VADRAQHVLTGSVANFTVVVDFFSVQAAAGIITAIMKAASAGAIPAYGGLL